MIEGDGAYAGLPMVYADLFFLSAGNAHLILRPSIKAYQLRFLFKQHFLYFLPLPHGQGEFLPTFLIPFCLPNMDFTSDLKIEMVSCLNIFLRILYISI